jgi:predicted DNA-binding transcriptional regulator AlpA
MATHRTIRNFSNFAPDAWRNVMQDGDFGNQNRVLTSWKEIAAYLGKGVRTVQRWEKDFGLPVRRPTGSDKSAILARSHDIDVWVAMRCSPRGRLDSVSAPHHETIAMRTSLATGISTLKMLRDSNAALMSEVRAALLELRGQIMRLQNGVDLPPSGQQAAMPLRRALPNGHASSSANAA